MTISRTETIWFPAWLNSSQESLGKLEGWEAWRHRPSLTEWAKHTFWNRQDHPEQTGADDAQLDLEARTPRNWKRSHEGWELMNTKAQAEEILMAELSTVDRLTCSSPKQNDPSIDEAENAKHPLLFFAQMTSTVMLRWAAIPDHQRRVVAAFEKPLGCQRIHRENALYHGGNVWQCERAGGMPGTHAFCWEVWPLQPGLPRSTPGESAVVSGALESGQFASADFEAAGYRAALLAHKFWNLYHDLSGGLESGYFVLPVRRSKQAGFQELEA